MRVKSIAAKDPGQNILLNYQYNYDKMDNITAKATEHGEYDYGYDDLYRLTEAENPVQADEGFTYDAVGNRLTATGVADNWSYSDNNELQSYDNVTFEYDANGNMTKKTDAGQVTNYIYNLEDRLERVEDGSGSLIAQYYYDPFGRRLWKEVGGVRTYFVYADEGLVAEVDAAGNVVKSYGYKPGSTWSTDPLFMKVDGNYYFYQNDLLGTPQKLTAVNGAVVWSAKYSSFGKATVEVETVEINFRFPGQYFDEETGLHYNYHRYYNPKIGRYVKNDPIALQGGINFYRYSLNRPLTLIDPQGLKEICIPWFSKKTKWEVISRDRILWRFASSTTIGPFSVVCHWEKVKQNWRQRQVTKRELCWGGPCEPREPHVVEIETNIESEKHEEIIDTEDTPARWLPTGDGVIFYRDCDRDYRNPFQLKKKE